MVPQKSQSDPKKVARAREILLYSRRYITRRVPALLEAIYALPERVSDVPGALATNGEVLWYDPEQVIRDFRKDHRSVAMQLLHVTLHCLLGHLPNRIGQSDPDLFDAVADERVERFIEMLDGLGPQTKYQSLLVTLKRAETIPNIAEWVLQDRERWARDDHLRWQTPTEEKEEAGGGTGGACGKNGRGSVVALSGEGGNGPSAAPDWVMLANGIMSGGQGTLPGLLREALQPAEENGISYAQFLRRFASLQEQPHLSPDNFDPKLYHLGLELYDDIPLLEPSELDEIPVCNDLVIALDTSGSCSGDVCRRFLRETFNLLRDISGGRPSFRILLMQCDAVIQQELLLENWEQMERLAEGFVPQGFGGTDFRPVFQRVDRLQKDGVLPRVKALFYLSDGWGDFPEEKPEYPVTFFFLEEECDNTPDWVEALVLEKDSFTVKGAEHR